MIISILALLSLQVLSDAQLATDQNGQDIFPIAFRGTWGMNAAACRDAEGTSQIVISETRLTSYEGESILIKNAGLTQETTPDGKVAYSTMNLVASSGEGEVEMGKLRVSRVGVKLFTSRPELVSDADHFKGGWIRCK